MWSRGHHHEFPCTSRHATPHVCFTQSFLRRGVFTTPTSHNHFCGHWRPIRQHHDQQRRVATCSYDGSTDGPSDAEILKMDSNQLQTALNVAIASEDYQLAAVLRDVLTRLMGDNPKPADWQQLGVLDWLAERAERLGFRYPTEIQKRTVPVVLDGNDTIIRSATGSGKTMSFMLPAISRLPFPPAIDLQDVTGPLCLVLVPTRELGVQIIMSVYKLFGGSVNAGVPGESSNMFSYQGPRGLKVRGVVLPEEVERAVVGDYLRGVHVVVGLPSLLRQVLDRQRRRGMEEEDLLSCVRVVIVDEVDECFTTDASDTEHLLDAASAAHSNPTKGVWGPGSKPQIVFVGATVEPGLAEAAVAKGWLDDPVTVDMGGNSLPAGLQHRYILVPEDRKLAAMARQMRNDLREQGEDAPPARVMVFARSQHEAQALTSPLRNVLWGDHKISVLLPEGEDPIRALHSFRDNHSTLLLATPSAARGLDLPAVSHVYNVDVPEDTKGYLHRAGRAGRIGNTVPGVVTTLVTEEQLPALLDMADALQIEMQPVEEPPVEPLAGPIDQGERIDESEMERLKKGLEDLYNLF